jgi:hypothetical protein
LRRAGRAARFGRDDLAASELIPEIFAPGLAPSVNFAALNKTGSYNCGLFESRPDVIEITRFMEKYPGSSCL